MDKRLIAYCDRTQIFAGPFDMRIQNFEGVDVLQFMRSENRLMRIPILMLAADTDFRLMTKGFGAGVSVFLSKPFSARGLQSTLRFLVRANSKK
jgi:DNA-binding response OmpR family regulator